MKLENTKVCARLRESPAALFKVNKLALSEDEKSISISSLNGNKEIDWFFLIALTCRLDPWQYEAVKHPFIHSISNNILSGNFDNCFGKFSNYSDVSKGMDCPKYLKQLLHGYNSSILSFGVGYACHGKGNVLLKLIL